MSRTFPFAIVAVAIAAAALLFAAACSGGMGMAGGGGMMNGGGGMMGSLPEGVVGVNLYNWSVDPSTSSARAGEVTFRAFHMGMDMHSGGAGKTHDLAVARVNPDGSMEVLGQVKDIRMGQWKDLTLELAPGEYELQCNVVDELGSKTVSHYKKGMHTRFTVT